MVCNVTLNKRVSWLSHQTGSVHFSHGNWIVRKSRVRRNSEGRTRFVVTPLKWRSNAQTRLLFQRYQKELLTKLSNKKWTICLRPMPSLKFCGTKQDLRLRQKLQRMKRARQHTIFQPLFCMPTSFDITRESGHIKNIYRLRFCTVRV